MRIIDADAAVEFLTGLGNREYRSEKGTIRDAIKVLRHEEYTPTIDAEPVRHGHWKNIEYVGGRYVGECSVCDFERKIGNYCSHCGAKMDEEVNDV